MNEEYIDEDWIDVKADLGQCPYCRSKDNFQFEGFDSECGYEDWGCHTCGKYWQIYFVITYDYHVVGENTYKAMNRDRLIEAILNDDATDHGG